VSQEAGVRAIAQYQAGVIAKEGAVPSVHIPADLSVIMLWSALGLTLTALLCSLGFGFELGEVLAGLG
jgi:hypothetical protein